MGCTLSFTQMKWVTRPKFVILADAFYCVITKVIATGLYA